MKTIPIGPYLGINNRLPDFALQIRTRQKQGSYLRDALNVDIDDSAELRRRVAVGLVLAVTGAHSLHMTSDAAGYLVNGGWIYTVALPSTLTPVKLLTTDAPVSWWEDGDDVYYSSATDSGRFTAGQWYPLGMETPAAPGLSLIGGGLLPGWYQVAVSYSNSVTGEESGVSLASSIELTSTGGIRAALPAATDGATDVRIYLTDANGEQPYHLATVAVGAATHDCTALAAGSESSGQFAEKLPYGRLFMSNGRLCSFAGKEVCVGLPFQHGYYQPEEGTIPFATAVTVAVENQGGTYIATETETFWVPGDLGDVKETLVTVLPYGAVPGTEFMLDDRTICGWFGAMGFVFGRPTGDIDADMSEVIDLTAPASGVSAVYDSNGYTRVVSCGWCSNVENKAVTRYDGWEFNSLSRGFGLQSDGVYQIDTTGDIDYLVDFGRLNFGSPKMKHITAVYAGVASENALRMTVEYTDEHEIEQSYTYPTRGSGTALKERRFDTGLGLRSNWFRLLISNGDEPGTDFTLASLLVTVAETTRNI